jgi:hypothetical protein
MRSPGSQSVEKGVAERSDDHRQEPCSPGLVGVRGRPFLDLSHLVEPARLAEIDLEITRGLAQVTVAYTGGSHRSMGIVPKAFLASCGIDYREVIEAMDDEAYETFVRLADDPDELDEDAVAARDFGEERTLSLSLRQMRLLEFRYGVYFPWKVFYELLPVHYWDEKSSGAGKTFTREARVFFPQTVALLKSLPFREIGRALLLGLAANDHGTVHRDADPAEKTTVDHFLTICPRGDKRLFLWDDAAQRREEVKGTVYWFNDSDYHGVLADPFFRYSIRVDGVFTEEFLQSLPRS